MDDSLRTIREMVREREETLTFGDLSAPLLEDLAIGWHKGMPFASHVASFLAQVDGITAPQRDREIAGRALLTLLDRRGAPVARHRGDEVRLLGSPEEDTGDPEAIRAFDQRTAEYASLSALSPEYGPEDFAADAAGAFESSRTKKAEGASLPPDGIADEHVLALLGLRLPPGLRVWFHARYAASKGPAGADARAWKFVLASRALAIHREHLAASGLLADQGTAVPAKLLEAVLATDLGEMARTAVRDIGE